MEFIQRSPGHPAKVGLLAGSFNPPTIAHFELLRAAALEVDETVCVLPTAFPHKDYSGATLEQRLSMLRQLPCSIATTGQGLYIDIAREFRAFYGASTTISLLVGADAAERIVTWDYGREGVVDEMLLEFELLVAPRGSVYEPSPHHIHRIRPLKIEGGYHEVSSTEIRNRIQRGESWEHLVPPQIVELVREIYS